jgi:IS5 family transposase
MSQPGFFDLSRRYESLDAKKDPLVALNRLVPWENFRAQLLAALQAAGKRASAATRKSLAGRKPWDEVLIFKVLVLQTLYNLGDDNLEYLIRDRLSFMRFLGLGLHDEVPDAKTIWLYREALAQTDAVRELFDSFDAYLIQSGYIARGGQIIDATLVPVPVNRNTKAENAAIKNGDVPPEWQGQKAKLRQKDRDARWTRKNGKSYYGYKNHVNIDRQNKLVRCYEVSDAARHDSQAFESVLDDDNSSADIYADSAYRNAETEEKLARAGYRSRIHRRARRGHGLTERETQGNKTKSKVRARVEHIFGDMVNSMGGKLVRTIGITRARAKIGLQNLTYNMKRFVYLRRWHVQLCDVLVASNKLPIRVIAVALQNATVAAEQCVGVDMPAAGRVAVNHGRRRAAAPGAGHRARSPRNNPVWSHRARDRAPARPSHRQKAVSKSASSGAGVQQRGPVRRLHSRSKMTAWSDRS